MHGARIEIKNKSLSTLIFVINRSSSRQLFLGLKRLLRCNIAFWLSQFLIYNCHMLSSIDFVEFAPWQDPLPIYRSLVVSSKWPLAVKVYSAYPPSCCAKAVAWRPLVTELWGKPRLKHVRICSVIDFCVEQIKEISRGRSVMRIDSVATRYENSAPWHRYIMRKWQ
jgi:hypothetical protein